MGGEGWERGGGGVLSGRRWSNSCRQPAKSPRIAREFLQTYLQKIAGIWRDLCRDYKGLVFGPLLD